MTATATTVDMPLVTLTDTAVAELRKIIAEEGRDDIGLRVFVSPGGCSGLSYGMSLEEQSDEGDFVVQHAGLNVFVDEFTANFVRGSQIDFVKGLMGAGFTVQNPNAKKSCACGQSFDTGTNAETAQKCS
jgi:iron-sulfur cluster assembly protein